MFLKENLIRIVFYPAQCDLKKTKLTNKASEIQKYTAFSFVFQKDQYRLLFHQASYSQTQSNVNIKSE